jgi:hypothetical protein
MFLHCFATGLRSFLFELGFRGFLAVSWQFFVGAVVTGNYFVELARLIFVLRVGLA